MGTATEVVRRSWNWKEGRTALGLDVEYEREERHGRQLQISTWAARNTELPPTEGRTGGIWLGLGNQGFHLGILSMRHPLEI